MKVTETLLRACGFHAVFLLAAVEAISTYCSLLTLLVTRIDCNPHFVAKSISGMPRLSTWPGYWLHHLVQATSV
jgi:hypothetical protein